MLVIIVCQGQLKVIIYAAVILWKYVQTLGNCNEG